MDNSLSELDEDAMAGAASARHVARQVQFAAPARSHHRNRATRVPVKKANRVANGLCVSRKKNVVAAQDVHALHNARATREIYDLRSARGGAPRDRPSSLILRRSARLDTERRCTIRVDVAVRDRSSPT